MFFFSQGCFSPLNRRPPPTQAPPVVFQTNLVARPFLHAWLGEWLVMKYFAAGFHFSIYSFHLSAPAFLVDCSPPTDHNSPQGRWTKAPAAANEVGQTSCTESCAIGKFSSVTGASNAVEANCQACPPGYRNSQCDRKENGAQKKRAKEREKKLRLLRARQKSRQKACSE